MKLECDQSDLQVTCTIYAHPRLIFQRMMKLATGKKAIDMATQMNKIPKSSPIRE